MSLGYVEELAVRYFERDGYLVQSNVRFQLDKKKLGKKAAGWSDIDIVAVKPMEVKIVQCKSFSGTKKSELFTNEMMEWFDTAESFLRKDKFWKGWLENRKLNRVFIVDFSVPAVDKKLRAAGIEVLYYKEILKKLLGWLEDGPESRRKGKEDDMVIRLLVGMLQYGVIREDI